jgi:hypothetical protein
LDTLLDVFANCLLALPTDFTIACGSGRCLGTRTPRIVLRRVRLLIARPPATPAAAAPTATAGPFARLATSLIVSVMLLLLTRPLDDAVAAARPFDFAVLAVVRFVAVLGEREALALRRFEVLVFGWGSAIPCSSRFRQP